MTKSTIKTFCLILAWISLGLGIIGAFLPLIPTTPFVILSAYLFSKSSKKFHDWLLNQKYFGPILKDWEENKVISKKTKYQSTATILVTFSATIIFVKVSLYTKGLISLIGISVLIFIWTRKSKNSF